MRGQQSSRHMSPPMACVAWCPRGPVCRQRTDRWGPGQGKDGGRSGGGGVSATFLELIERRLDRSGADSWAQSWEDSINVAGVCPREGPAPSWKVPSLFCQSKVSHRGQARGTHHSGRFFPVYLQSPHGGQLRASPGNYAWATAWASGWVLPVATTWSPGVQSFHLCVQTRTHTCTHTCTQAPLMGPPPRQAEGRLLSGVGRPRCQQLCNWGPEGLGGPAGSTGRGTGDSWVSVMEGCPVQAGPQHGCPARLPPVLAHRPGTPRSGPFLLTCSTAAAPRRGLLSSPCRLPAQGQPLCQPGSHSDRARAQPVCISWPTPCPLLVCAVTKVSLPV